MLTINLKDVNLENYTTILSLIKGLNMRTINGADMRSLTNVSIKMIQMKNFCNIFHVKHLTPKGKFELTNIYLKGKYNLINLIDLPKGTFQITVHKSDDTIDNLLSSEKRENIDLIFDKLSSKCEVSRVLLIKDKSEDFQIDNSELDYTKNKVVYLKDINGVEPTAYATIDLTYDHNKLYLICENVNAIININNQSEPRVGYYDKSKQNHTGNPDVITHNQFNIPNRHTQLDTFTNSSNITCTSGGEKLVIALIIFAIYKLLTKRQIIKIFE
jgi:hypothetical protein|uniref:Uncharacterized protein n=1 Tax=viral metagenome TaxID=1070528 RepID=A0A6C0IV52_9ZZZZ